MPSAKPLHVDTLPFFGNADTRCWCGATRDIYVMFCRNCAQVGGGEHYHRACQGCGRRWLEQTREVPSPPDHGNAP